MLKFCFIGISFCALFITASQTLAKVIDRVVAIVNGDIITYSELQDEGQTIFKQISEKAPAWQIEQTKQKAREELLERLIDKLIIEQRAKNYNISVSEGEIDAAINNMLADNGVTLDQFKNELQQAGVTIEGYRESTRTQMLQSRLISLEVRSKVVITDEKINDYYNQHYVNQAAGEGYHILQIGVSWADPRVKRTKEEAKDIIQKLKDRIDTGENFREIAKDFSDLPSAIDGGDIGIFAKNELASYMRDAITSMQPGDISPIVETPAGFQILKLISIRKGDVTVQEPYDSVKNEIKELLYEEELKTHFDKWVNELREEAYIKKLL